MKKIALCIAATAALSSSAFGADMAVKARPMIAEPLFTWTGFYIGVNGGDSHWICWRHLSRWNQTRARFLAAGLPCEMRELGERSDAYHADLAGPVLDAGVERVILVGEAMAALANAPNTGADRS